MKLSFRSWLTSSLLLGLTVVLVSSMPSRAAMVAESASRALFSRVAVTGASISDGFLLPLEVDAMVTLADTLGAALPDGTAKPVRRTSSWVFRNPQYYGTHFVDDLVAQKPTLVIAVDFLFWFGYGLGYSEPQRLELCDAGIALLDRFSCPIVVGDYPNMTQALGGKGIIGGPMIQRGHFPAAVTRAEMNKRLREWAKKRGNVTILESDAFIEKIKRNEAFDVLGNRYDGDLIKTLLDRDLLHTTFEGEVALTLMIVDALLKSPLGLTADDFVTERSRLKSRVLDARAKEIAQRRRR